MVKGPWRCEGKPAKWTCKDWLANPHTLTSLPCTHRLPSLVILPVPEEPLASPARSLSIHSLEALSLQCLQPFSTQDTQGRPFHARAQEALNVLLRHPSGGAGWKSGDSTFCLQDPSGPGVLNPCPPLAHRLVAGAERRPADGMVSCPLPRGGSPRPGRRGVPAPRE